MTKRKDSNTAAPAGMVSRRRFVASAGLGLGALAMPGAARAQGATGSEDTLDRIKRTGVFNLGAREATPPYGYKDAAGKYVGFATEIAQAIHANVEKALGSSIKLNYIPVTSETRIPLLQNGTIDMEAGATVVTQARVEVVDFSVPDFLTATEVLVPADSPIKSLADLAGKRIGVPQGGLEEAAYRELNAKGRLKPPVTTVGFPDHPQGFTALQTGSIDAYSSDGPILYGMKDKAADKAKWRVFDPGINTFLQAFPLRPESSKFKRIVDLTIVRLCASGGWDKLYEKYFGPQGVAPFPQTEALKTLVVMNAWPPR
ncbi:MAG TPA: transporter substrate-binding domain-containing protein [Alphaproteobacteria bacterium]|nr:transporter substrate-binding domain-containing protein [Alphaproteobacteria bacterium]